MFKKIDEKLNFSEIEKNILDLWEKNDIFNKSRQKNSGKAKYRFMDGPITANNPMGVHHAWGRTLKDIFQRYKSMNGFEQRFQNGFDCQGLWVEVEVEKEIGLKSKKDIEKYGLDKFSTKCRERVDKFSKVITEQSIKLGQWMDWKNSYYTMTDTNIEYIWHFLKKCSEKKWLYKGTFILPWCIRCGTSLSQHELADSYREIVHPSIFVRFPLKDRKNESLVVWTTTAWTLPANVSAAVHPDLDYLKVKKDEKIYYFAKAAQNLLEAGAVVLDTIKGSELVGWEYESPFNHLPAQKGVKHKIIPWKEVGEAEGSGIVHIAPGCGEADNKLGKEYDLPEIAPLDENGNYVGDFDWLTGNNVRDAAEPIIADLEKRGFIYKIEKISHRYPVCWRCGQELVFRLVSEWFIRCDEIRSQMKKEAAKVKWYPEHTGKLMQDWLDNMRDWCISRKRYWGLPLMFFECDCGAMEIIGSLAELKSRAINPQDVDNLPELHRPWIDNIRVKCPKCGKEVARVKEVGDCWLDAGIVPFSTLKYFEDKEYWRSWFPTEFICEMREQIRLWFYSQLFMSVVLEGTTPYLKVLAYEKVYDEHGKPMHKSTGNVIWFDEAVEKMGADVMRWIYARQDISQNLRFGYEQAHDVKRRLLTLWNSYSFFVGYANLDKPDLKSGEKLPKEVFDVMDLWILAKLNLLIKKVKECYEDYDTQSVITNVEIFLEDISNWYIRLNRRRFWKGEKDADKQAAYYTLYTVIVSLIKLMAPILPFLTEEMYQSLVRSVYPDAPESVHLCDFPEPDELSIDQELLDNMALVRSVTAMGHSARDSAGLKVRQPLGKIFFGLKSKKQHDVLEEFKDLILTELNIKECHYADNLKMFQNQDGTIKSDFIMAEENEIAVVIDIKIDEKLLSEGIARDFVRNIQNMRKKAGYNVEDKIEIFFRCDDIKITEAVSSFSDYIKNETLAADIKKDRTSDNWYVQNFKIKNAEIETGVLKIK